MNLLQGLGMAKPVSEFTGQAIQYGQFQQQTQLREMQMQKAQQELAAYKQEQEELHKPQNIRNSVLYFSLPEDKREEFANQYIQAGYADPDGNTSLFKRNKFLNEHKQGVDLWFSGMKENARGMMEKAMQKMQTAKMSGDPIAIAKAENELKYSAGNLATIDGKYKEAMGLFTDEEAKKVKSTWLDPTDNKPVNQMENGTFMKDGAPFTPTGQLQPLGAPAESQSVTPYKTFYNTKKAEGWTDAQIDAEWAKREQQKVEARIPAFTAAPGVPPGYVLNRKNGNYEWKGEGPAPGMDPATSAEYSANKKSTENQTKIRDMMQSYVKNMNAQIDRLGVILDDVTRVDARLANVPIRKWAMTVKGSAAESKVSMYLTEISNEIGKLSTGSAASVQELSQEAQKKWDKIHDPNLNIKDLLSLLRETKHAGDLRMKSIDDSLGETKGRMRTKGSGGANTSDPLGLGL